MVSGGVVIAGGNVQHSILFPHVTIGDEAIIHDSILFNGVQVGDGADLDRCIIDKGVKIPSSERIGFDSKQDAERFTISGKGIVVVPKGYRFEMWFFDEASYHAVTEREPPGIQQPLTTAAGHRMVMRM